MADLLADIWDKILRYFQKNDNQSWRAWFEQIEPISLNNGLLRVGVSQKNWQHYLQQHVCKTSLKEAAQHITGHLLAIEVVLIGQDELSNLDTDTPDSSDTPMLYFSPDYTFDNFVVGPCNRLVHAACVAVSKTPGSVYNPLFIYGDVGLGKTHLLQAACQTILNQNPKANVMYMSCETFVNHFIRAVEKGDLFNFQYKYRHVDMLVIDDIQFLSNRDRSQEEFFHTFNTLYQSGKQIIMSADCSPAEIPNLEDRLISRFNHGLVTRIDKPCYETRMAILNKKAMLRGISVPDEVISLIAKKITSNTRELEGALTKIHGMAMLDGGEITFDLAQQAFGKEPPQPKKQITIAQIITSVTEHFNVKLSDLQGKRRSRSITYPRQISMYLARQLTTHSLEEIGGYFGGRDHTTALYACRTIDKLCDHDENSRATVNQLLNTLTQE